jgi:hypothetical protein
MFWCIFSWLHYFGPVVRQHIMIGGREELMKSNSSPYGQEADERREGAQEHP